ncbi:MAG TPA: NUDIX domain-containing protein [Leptospiraceae bacterium]|nr:NUDIX domain-containing protein [Leptospiraceae bacterium]
MHGKPGTPCFCPACGNKTLYAEEGKKFECTDCRFIFFKNVASAVGVILEHQKRILLITRARDPGKGLYDVPGGFCDEWETPEETAGREIKEELNLNVSNFQYLASFPNRYLYKNILYHTMDMIYLCRLGSAEGLKPEEEEVHHFEWFSKEEIPLEKIAFPSIRKALSLYIDGSSF